ncbi:MAG TPA: hypothetical protein VJX66_05395, partial [Amycolatopsis sp.]|nr:hypothetical protein [Amycolatopsis sp.]
ILCGQDGTAPDCSALPLLTANYRLDTAMDGTISARQGKAVVTFGHTPGAWNLPIRQAKFEVSFDGGTTWQRACLDQVGYNRYRATWDNPSAAKATDVALRVSATDIFGASISQRVTAAYTVPPQS